jgi:hypothetical protein
MHEVQCTKTNKSWNAQDAAFFGDHHSSKLQHGQVQQQEKGNTIKQSRPVQSTTDPFVAVGAPDQEYNDAGRWRW